jgi:hypothetical protein
MLTSVVFVIHNLRRGHQSPEERGLTRLGGRAVVFPSQNPLVAGYSSPIAGFLIANPRLESKLSSNHPSQLQISNRERMAFCRSGPSREPSITSSAQLLSSNLQLLIVTPRLESPATPTKQNSNAISNRYKTRFSLCSPARHPSLASVAPTSRKAIMSRNHFNQTPRPKRKVTNADPNQS